MGIFSSLISLLSTPNDKKIEQHKKTIENCQRNIEIIRKNTANKKQQHYHETARKNIATLEYRIKKEKEKIASLKK